MAEITYAELQKVEEIEDTRDINSNRFKPGDIFLYGENLIKQKHTKQAGDSVTVYQIFDINEGNCVYFPKLYKIKKETKNA